MKNAIFVSSPARADTAPSTEMLFETDSKPVNACYTAESALRRKNGYFLHQKER